MATENIIMAMVKAGASRQVAEVVFISCLINLRSMCLHAGMS